MLISKNSRKSVLYFSASGRKYAAIVHPLKLSSKSNNANLIVYYDLFKSKGFVDIVSDNRLLILIIMAIISNNVSKKISSPISLLSDYAKKI